MPYLIGVCLAPGIAGLAHLARFDRDRSFYPTVLIVIASYYDLFAVTGGSTDALVRESGGVALFVAMAWLAFRYSAWFAVAGLSAHGVFDFFHGHLVSNPGVPLWWPQFCLAYDVAAAVILAWLNIRKN